jgi:hypothetical protein
MKMRRYFFFLLAIFFFADCTNTENKNPVQAADYANKKDSFSRFIYRFADSTLEAKIADTLMQLPFVVKTNNYIDSFSHHKQGISFMPDTSDKKISVMAGYNGPERFETYYNFTINPATFEIKVLDQVTGEYVSVAEYIKKNKE